MSRIIGGGGKGRRLQAPSGQTTRPTGARVRQTLFDILAPRIQGARFLDVCAGSGAVGLEALSRGAQRAVFVESARSASAVIDHNIGTLGLGGGQALVQRQDARVALRALARSGQRFEVVFLDPPYESDLYEVLLPLIGPILADDGIVIAEHFHKRVLAETIGALERVRQVRIGDHLLDFYRPAGEGGRE